MINEQEQYKNLKYFIESYFNWSMDYADLGELIEEYKKRESSLHVEGLVQEIKEISEHRNWEEIKNFVYLHGRRNLSNKKIEQMIELFMAKLTGL
ncbi:contact-dependent growth inhibition system immunity protein [Paenibacillus aceti]|uniref:CdiI immunity protein domain-containing protein n=1 Tax=Paenibacillus aceti TaxID=1820010 RepID=A0ABQ1VX94_9BACL|nr:contact-dependent growth inhibition system immunity protein [Paenibacillus aceti]GGG03000.1 hypothetical protein GCM10010913_25940 [Paenibacillus aceti]